MFEINFTIVQRFFIMAPCLLPRRFLGVSAVVAAQRPSFETFPCAFAFFEVPYDPCDATTVENARIDEVRDSTAPVNLPRLPRVFQISDSGFADKILERGALRLELSCVERAAGIMNR